MCSAGMNQRDPQAAAVRADVEEVGQRAHLVDLDLDAGLLGFLAGAALRVRVRRRLLASASGSRRRKSGWLPPRNQRQPSQRAAGLLARLRKEGAARCAPRAPACRCRAGRGSAAHAAGAPARRASESRIGWFQGCTQNPPGCARAPCGSPAAPRTRRSRARAPARPGRARGRRRARARRTRGPRARSGRAAFRTGSRVARCRRLQSNTSVRSGARPGCAAAPRRSISSSGTPFPAPW